MVRCELYSSMLALVTALAGVAWAPGGAKVPVGADVERVLEERRLVLLPDLEHLPHQQDQ